MSPDAIAVVIVTYRNAEHIGAALRALAHQLRDDDELVVVDNASGDGTAEVARSAADRAEVLRQERNLGFAGGCHRGAEASTAPLLLFLNPDALAGDGCLDALRRVADDRPDWGAWQALVTMTGGTRINSSGNVAHFLGMGWAGRCGEPLESAPAEPVEVPFPSGAALVVRREAWEGLCGFDERYFMYGEDLDLGLRLRLAGWGVGVAPAGRVEHDYDFIKGGTKWFLLERNRWWTVLGDYPAALLLLVLAPLLITEVALLAVAARSGWLRQKLRAQGVVISEMPQILERRRRVQGTRRISTHAFAQHLSAELESPYLKNLARTPVLPGLQRLYWRTVLAVLSRTGPARS